LKLEIDKRLKKIDLDYHNNQSLYKLDFNIDAERNGLFDYSHQRQLA
jgi:hypothetical protein